MGSLFAGIVKLFNGILAWFGRTAGAVGAWLKEDHDWWKIGCFSLAALFALAAFVAYDAKQEILLVRTACVAEKDKLTGAWTVERFTLSQNAENARKSLKEIAGIMDEQAQKLAALQQQNTQLAAENEKLQEKAAKSYAAFMAEYETRPEACKSAAALLEQACPTLNRSF